jgi:hypothetical protein
MNKEELKSRLHKYIDDASEEELEEMLWIVEESDVEYEVEGKRRDWWNDEAFVKELDRRMEEIDSGKVKAIPAEEVHARALERLKKRRSDDGK